MQSSNDNGSAGLPAGPFVIRRRFAPATNDNGQIDVLIPLSSSASRYQAGDSLCLTIAVRYPDPGNPFFGRFPDPLRAHQQGQSEHPPVAGRAVLSGNPRYLAQRCFLKIPQHCGKLALEFGFECECDGLSAPSHAAREGDNLSAEALLRRGRGGDGPVSHSVFGDQVAQLV
ncbi:MAG: hypothetical protein ABI206_05895 [Antricoccus sp.]